MRFKEYIHLIENHTDSNYAKGMYLPADYADSWKFPNYGYPSLNTNFSIPTDIPKTNVTSIIQEVKLNKNPILILLQDGTKMYFTWDQYKRIPGSKPEPGRKMMVVFQRHPTNLSEKNSKIESCYCY